MNSEWKTLFKKDSERLRMINCLYQINCESQRVCSAARKVICIFCTQRAKKSVGQTPKLSYISSRVPEKVKFLTPSLLCQGQGPDWEKKGILRQNGVIWVSAFENLKFPYFSECFWSTKVIYSFKDWCSSLGRCMHKLDDIDVFGFQDNTQLPLSFNPFFTPDQQSNSWDEVTIQPSRGNTRLAKGIKGLYAKGTAELGHMNSQKSIYGTAFDGGRQNIKLKKGD